MPKVKTITEIIRENNGRLATTFLGRNDYFVRFILNSISITPRKVLILGCGYYDLWSMCGQKALRGGKVKVLGVDSSEGVRDFNKKVAESGLLDVSDVCDAVSDSLICTKAECLELNHFSRAFLKLADISGVQISGDFVSISEENRRDITMRAQDARNFAAESDENFDFIFSGHLEDNLTFQESYSYAGAIKYHANLARVLNKGGLYGFTTNEECFSSTKDNDVKNGFAILEQSGLEVLFKITQFARLTKRESADVLLEDCGIICGKSGDYEKLKNFSVVMPKIKSVLDKAPPRLDIKHESGTLKEFLDTLRVGQTNMALIKKGRDLYEWFNTPLSYRDAFSELASYNTWGNFGFFFYY